MDVRRITQLNPALLPEIQKYGCLFLSMAASSTCDFSPQEINACWHQCLKNGWITGDVNQNGSTDDPEDLCVIRAHYDDIMELFKSRYRFQKQVTTLPEVRNVHAHHIACYVWKGGTHFVVTSASGVVVYDPTPYSNSVREGRVAHYKIFV